LLKGTAAVTAEITLGFTRLTGGAPELDLNMQTGFDLETAQQRLQNELADIAPGPQHHPSAAISTGKSKTSIRDTRLSRR
jgi:plasmid maintenance system antidote protein VapI